MIRIATPQDHEQMLKIYAYYIKETSITFECEISTASAFSKRMAAFQEAYPCLVLEADGKVAAYAYAHRMFERSAYQWDAELSVYCDHSCKKLGYGSKLLRKLLELLEMMGIVNVYSLVTLPNAGSEALHQRLGFLQTGVYHQTGFKHGAWHDVGVYEKALRKHPQLPAAVTPFPDLNNEEIRKRLEES